MAFGKKSCCEGCARKPSKARISGNPIAHLFQMGGEVMKELESTDPLFIHEDEGYNTAVLSDMVKRDIDEEEVLVGMAEVPLEEERISDIALDRLKAAGQGFKDAPGFVANYLLDFDEKGQITPISASELGFDALNLGKGILSYAQEDPLGFTLDMIPGISNIRAGQDANALYAQAEELEEEGDFLGAAKTRSLATLSTADMFNPLPGGVFLKGIIAGPMARRGSQRLNDPRLKEIEESGEAGITTFNQSPTLLEESVFNETGAFIGADGKPKFEIDTSNVTVDKDKLLGLYMYGGSLGKAAEAPLSQIIEFPELFENYPQLSDMPVRFKPLQGNIGRYTPDMDPRFRLPKGIDIDLHKIPTQDLKGTASALLHEVQHAVQDIEGFLQRGSVPSDLMTRNEYLGLPLEIEARNVQRRFEDPTLRTQLPETTVDIFPDTASDPQTLKMRDSVPTILESRSKPPVSPRQMELDVTLPEPVINDTPPRTRGIEGILDEGRRVDPYEHPLDTRDRRRRNRQRGNN